MSLCHIMVMTCVPVSLCHSDGASLADPPSAERLHVQFVDHDMKVGRHWPLPAVATDLLGTFCAPGTPTSSCMAAAGVGLCYRVGYMGGVALCYRVGYRRGVGLCYRVGYRSGCWFVLQGWLQEWVLVCVTGLVTGVVLVCVTGLQEGVFVLHGWLQEGCWFVTWLVTGGGVGLCDRVGYRRGVGLCYRVGYRRGCWFVLQGWLQRGCWFVLQGWLQRGCWFVLQGWLQGGVGLCYRVECWMGVLFGVAGLVSVGGCVASLQSGVCMRVCVSLMVLLCVCVCV